MTESQNNELKLSSIVKQAKQAHETESFELPSGESITFYPIFPDLMVEDLTEELQHHYRAMDQKGIVLNEKMTLYFIQLMAIKHFTHFKSQMPNEILGVDDTPGLLDYMNHFADTGLLKTLVEDMFMKEQLQKIYGKLTDVISTFQLSQQMEADIKKKYETLQFKNKGVFEEIAKINLDKSKNKKMK